MGIALAKISEEVDKEVAPQTLGMVFRSARMRQDKNLEAISEQLKIRKVFLQAIENEQFDILPGGVYTVGFIRSYAQYLGLDHNAIIEQLKDESFFSPVRLSSVGDEQHFPTTRFVPSTMVFIGLLLLVLCGISAYFFLEDAPIHINWPSVMTKASL